jgi:D-lactate dehydrogenase (cytochrome)
MPSHCITARAPRGATMATAIDRTPDAIDAHLEDAAHVAGGHADGIARPRTEADVSALVQTSRVVLPIGAQSSLTGGATPNGGLLLSTDRFIDIARDDGGHVKTGAGVSVARLQDALGESHQWYPPVPTFTGAFVGGVVATNAAGAATFKYGTTRDWVDGLTVVLACGCVLDLIRGNTVAHTGTGFEIGCAHGTRRVTTPSYRLPRVPKCSAGYFAAPEMDLVDLFVGSEGTLGIVTEARLRVLPERPAVAMALVAAESEDGALALVADLRREARTTWRTSDAGGINIAAIEHIDCRCVEMIREDRVDMRNDITIPSGTNVVLFVQVELPAGSSAASLYQDVASALGTDAPDTPTVRLCRLLDRHGVLDRTELAMPGDRRRLDQFMALREAAPTGTNRRVGDAKRDVDRRIEKTAADMIVPFEHFGEMMRIYRDGYAVRGLDFAIWGHISDGNVHPNVIPRSLDDVTAGREAILAFGLDVARLGGCPLAEHGVGRSSVKQQLLRNLYGETGLDEMRAVKRALDPDWKLSPGVLFGRI